MNKIKLPSQVLSVKQIVEKDISRIRQYVYVRVAKSKVKARLAVIKKRNPENKEILKDLEKKLSRASNLQEIIDIDATLYRGFGHLFKRNNYKPNYPLIAFNPINEVSISDLNRGLESAKLKFKYPAEEGEKILEGEENLRNCIERFKLNKGSGVPPQESSIYQNQILRRNANTSEKIYSRNLDYDQKTIMDEANSLVEFIDKVDQLAYYVRNSAGSRAVIFGDEVIQKLYSIFSTYQNARTFGTQQMKKPDIFLTENHRERLYSQLLELSLSSKSSMLSALNEIEKWQNNIISAKFNSITALIREGEFKDRNRRMHRFQSSLEGTIKEVDDSFSDDIEILQHQSPNGVDRNLECTEQQRIASDKSNKKEAKSFRLPSWCRASFSANLASCFSRENSLQKVKVERQKRQGCMPRVFAKR